MIIILEFGRPALSPGWFRSTLDGKTFIRVWFLWFAVSLWRGSLREFGEAVDAGEWIEVV